MMGCALKGYRGIPCSPGRPDLHHGISRQQLRGSPRAKKYVDAHMDIFGFLVCNAHNAQTKVADLPEARAILFARRCEEIGAAVVGAHLERLRRVMKSSPPELRLEAILNYLPGMMVNG